MSPYLFFPPVAKFLDLSCRRDMDAATGNSIQVGYKYHLHHVIIHFNGASHLQSLRFIAVHILLIYPMRCNDLIHGPLFNREENIFINIASIGFDGQYLFPLVDRHCADTIHMVKKGRQQVLGCMLLHIEISMVPIKREGFRRTQRRKLSFNHMQWGSVLIFSRIRYNPFSKASSVPRLTSTLGVENGFVKNHHAISYFYDSSFRLLQVWILVIQ